MESPILDICRECVARIQNVPIPWLLLFVASTGLGVLLLLYTTLALVAPFPQEPRKSEQQYVALEADGSISDLKDLPCWQHTWQLQRRQSEKLDSVGENEGLEEPELFMSVVVPAYNEEDRLEAMLKEAVVFLDDEYGGSKGPKPTTKSTLNGHANGTRGPTLGKNARRGWEILVVSDGSTDRTEETALRFARRHKIYGRDTRASVRVVRLLENRGKGGAVVHGMKHVRGQYVVFADADGASKFEDLRKLVAACQRIEDSTSRAVAVGSRAHLVGSAAVVQRSLLRNFLMHSFHILLRVLTPPATARIGDTQCGFKLFSRAALPYIVPHMHSQGWIFDVEMLMLAEFANIPVVEVPVGWVEVKGSKLNVIVDSIGMAWTLAVLRAAWAFGVYRMK